MLWWTLQNVLITALLAGGVWLICRWSRISPATRHALWLIVLLKLLTPPVVVWPWTISMPSAHGVDLQAVEIETLPSESFVAEAASSGAPALPTEDASPGMLIAMPEASVVESVGEPIPAPARTRAYFSSESFLAAVGLCWLIGGVVFGSLQGWRIRRMVQTVCSALPADDVLDGRLHEMSRRLKMRPITARQASGIGAPLVWALIRPVLLWPVELHSLPVVSQQALLVHELAHVKRRDHWVGWLELIAGCLWWWNPVFWYVRHQLRENAELACDAWVVATLPTSRRAYADALLFVCERVSRPTAMFAVGVSAGGRRSLERRLTMILRQQVSLRLSRIGLLAVLAVFTAVLPAWSQRFPVETPEPVLGASNFAEAAVLEPIAEVAEPAPAALAPPGDALPADAQEVLRGFDQEQAEIRRDAEKKIADRREQVLKQLKELQDRYTREARLDEAVAIRDQIRELRIRALTAGQPVQKDPGSLYGFRDRRGQTLYFEVTGDTQPYIWGTDIYTDDSRLATAAVHAGVLKPQQKGIVRVTMLPTPGNYQGSTRNGVTSHSFGSWSGAYRVEAVDRPATATTASPATSTTWSPDMKLHRSDTVGQTYLIDIVGATNGFVWGTDVYTDDSHVGTAAVHAGVLQPGERGTIQMTILGGRNSYQGSTRHGVTSYAFGHWPAKSFSVQRAPSVGSSRLGPSSSLANPLVPPGRDPIDLIPFTLMPSPGSILYTEVVGTTGGFVWGSDVYTCDSSVAAAAVHAGVLREGERGRIKVTFVPGRDNYGGTARNGITSHSWGSFTCSFVVERAERTP